MTNTPTTEVADRYLGNIQADRDLSVQIAEALEANQCLEVTIERKDCGKGRILTQAVSGQSVGIVKGRDWQLRNGDVLKTQRDRPVLVSLQKQQVIALRFEQKAYSSPAQLVNLGHTMGNHHWPIKLQGETLYVEILGNAEQIEATIREIVQTLGIDGLRIVRELKSANHTLDFSSATASTHTHAH